MSDAANGVLNGLGIVVLLGVAIILFAAAISIITRRG